MLEYTLVSATTQDALTENVTSKINEGWVPLGGVAVSVSGSETRFYQTMIKSAAQ